LKKQKKENPATFLRTTANPVNEHQQNLMNYLNQRIKTIEAKLQSTHQHLFYQEEEYASLLEKMQDIKLKYSRAVLLITEFIESFVEKNPDLLQQQSDMFLDIDSIKEAEDIRSVTDETIVALCLVLLK